MKNLIILSVLGWLLFASCNKEEKGVDDQLLTEEEIKGLIFIRQEEKLAYDVYRYSFDKYGSYIFNNIANSELTHQNKIQDLLDEYGIENPVKNLGPGEFENENLKVLYNQFIQKVNISLVDAFEVGATIEDLDIFDLMQLTASTQHEELTKLYTTLACGSRNHIRGFTGQLKNLGKDYAPQFLDLELFHTLINGNHENCNP